MKTVVTFLILNVLFILVSRVFVFPAVCRSSVTSVTAAFFYLGHLKNAFKFMTTLLIKQRLHKQNEDKHST